MVLELKLPASNIELNFPDGLSSEAFEELCFANKELVVEREPDGKIVIMSPVSNNSSDREAEFIADLKIYARQYGGKAYSSQGGFTLPDGSVRMSDDCYVGPEQLEEFTHEDPNHFAPIVPKFIVEVISPTDRLSTAMSKMKDVWMANGVVLGWLVDVEAEKLWVYRQNGSVDLI